MYVAALIVCSLYQCYRYGLYSGQEFATKEECKWAFSFVPMTYYRGATSLRFQCMLKKDWLELPPYPKKTDYEHVEKN